MQVLESTVFSAILAAADRRTVEGGRLLEVGACRRMTGYEQRTEGVQGWRNLQWLHRMKEWATFAFIACPGEIFAETDVSLEGESGKEGRWNKAQIPVNEQSDQQLAGKYAPPGSQKGGQADRLAGQPSVQVVS